MLDIGCGNGRSTLASAVWRPGVDHLSSDVLPVVIRYATRRANQRGLTNIRFAVVGGRELLADYITPRSIAEIHVYHPQPYYEADQVYRETDAVLFANPPEVLQLIKLRELYGWLEETVDACKDVSMIISEIVIKGS